jgi:hypothetical protein
MKPVAISFFILCVLLAACSAAPASPSPSVAPAATVGPTRTPRNLMLPTWTPSPTSLPKPSPTPRDTSTPLSTAAAYAAVTPTALSKELLIDRPASAELANPAKLVTLEYAPQDWMLDSFYITSFMGYSLSSRSIYGCKLEPGVPSSTEGYEVETYARQFGSTPFQVSRASKSGELEFTDYCTGEAADSTCYKMTPGDDHTACSDAAEAVLSSFQLIDNPWYAYPLTSANHWACQDAAGTVGLCLISYSVPLNTLAYTLNGQGCAGGADGILLQQVGQSWQQVESPATHPINDMDIATLSTGWAVGDGAEVLSWDGNTWKEVLPYHAPGEGPGGSTQTLFGVDAVSKNEAWMVGTIQGLDGRYQPYALHWNGTDLVEQNAFPDCNCGLNAVLELGTNDVYGVGSSDMGAMVFHWDGTTWSGATLPGADHLYTIIQAPDRTLWTGGIEVSRDQTDTRGALFHFDGVTWQRVATPPLTGGIYALSALPTGQIVLGGDFTALRDGLEWQPIVTDIAGYGWIADIEQDPRSNVWALTHSGNLFELVLGR